MFTPEFLREKIRQGDMLAVAVAGEQKVDVVECISDRAGAPGWEGTVIRASLAQIGGEAAIEALLQQIDPKAVERNREIFNLLSRYGDETAINILKKYGQNPNSEESWAAFQQIIDAIMKRRERDKKRAESQPTPGTQSQPAEESR